MCCLGLFSYNFLVPQSYYLYLELIRQQIKRYQIRQARKAEIAKNSEIRLFKFIFRPQIRHQYMSEFELIMMQTMAQKV